MGLLDKQNKCHAIYSTNRTIKISFVDVPLVMVLPHNAIVPGPTPFFEVTMQQLPIYDQVFQLKGYKYLYTIEK